MKKPKIDLNTLLFYISYTLLMLYYSFSKVTVLYEFRMIIYRVILPFILLFVVLFENKKYNKRIFLSIIALEILSLIVCYKSYNMETFYLLTMIIISRNIKFDNFIKYDLILKTMLIILVPILNKLGIAESVYNIRKNGLIRDSLGFSHPNTFGLYLLIINCEIFYLSYRKKINMPKIIKYLFFIISVYIVDYFSDSRSSIMCLIVLFILNMLFPKIEKNNRLQKMIPYLPFCLMILSLIMLYLYSLDFNIINNINMLLSNRLLHALSFYKYYSVNLFGNYFEFYGDKTNWYLSVLDNGYLNMLLQYGIIFSFIFLNILKKILRNGIKYKNYYLVVIITVYLIYALMERNFYVIVYNPFLLYYSNMLKNRKEVNYESN